MKSIGIDRHHRHEHRERRMSPILKSATRRAGRL
jgi:hypothetical protein